MYFAPDRKKGGTYIRTFKFFADSSVSNGLIPFSELVEIVVEEPQADGSRLSSDSVSESGSVLSDESKTKWTTVPRRLSLQALQAVKQGISGTSYDPLPDPVDPPAQTSRSSSDGNEMSKQSPSAVTDASKKQSTMPPSDPVPKPKEDTAIVADLPVQSLNPFGDDPGDDSSPVAVVSPPHVARTIARPPPPPSLEAHPKPVISSVSHRDLSQYDYMAPKKQLPYAENSPMFDSTITSKRLSANVPSKSAAPVAGKSPSSSAPQPPNHPPPPPPAHAPPPPPIAVAVPVPSQSSAAKILPANPALIDHIKCVICDVNLAYKRGTDPNYVVNHHIANFHGLA
jgi:hypothetical protein